MKSVRPVCVLQWIGRLGPLLHAFDTDASDLLTADPAALHLNNRSGYHAHGLRNYLRDDQVWKALLAPARYTRRLLWWLHAEVRKGRHAFCETRGPSLCHAQAHWCRQASLRATRPELFSDQYSCCSKVSAHAVVEAQQRWEDAAVDSRPPGMFVHKMEA